MDVGLGDSLDGWMHGLAPQSGTNNVSGTRLVPALQVVKTSQSFPSKLATDIKTGQHLVPKKNILRT
jgi:hypothetical protein